MGIVQGLGVRLTIIICNSPQKYSLVKLIVFVDKKQLFIETRFVQLNCSL